MRARPSPRSHGPISESRCWCWGRINGTPSFPDRAITYLRSTHVHTYHSHSMQMRYRWPTTSSFKDIVQGWVATLKSEVISPNAKKILLAIFRVRSKFFYRRLAFGQFLSDRTHSYLYFEVFYSYFLGKILKCATLSKFGVQDHSEIK